MVEAGSFSQSKTAEGCKDHGTCGIQQQELNHISEIDLHRNIGSNSGQDLLHG